MKLSKKLIITGLLFSSVLGSVNVGAITAMAAEGAGMVSTDTRSKSVTVHFITYGNKETVDSKTVTVKVDNDNKIIDINVPDPKDGYQIISKSNLKIERDSENNEIINVPVNKTETVSIKYLNEGNPVEITAAPTKVTVPTSDTEVSTKVIGNLSGYRLKDNQNFVITKEQNNWFVNVNVEKTKKVNIKYLVNGTETKIDGAKKDIEVLYSDKTINADEISNALGDYRITDDRKTFDISDNGDITVKVRKARMVNVIFTKENGVDISNIAPDKAEVSTDATEVTSAGIKAPAGWEVIKDQKVKINITGNSKSEYVRIKLSKIAGESNVETESVKLNFTDDKGFAITDAKLPKTINVKKNSTKVELKDVKLPAGYKLATAIDPTIKDGAVTIVIAKAEVVKLNVSYVDKDTKKKVSTVKLTGSAGTANKLDIPAGYKVVDGSSNVIKFSKGVTEVTILVEKVTPIQAHQSTISTFPGGYVSLYDSKGKVVTNRALSASSSWSSDKIMTLNGVKYYRVATNEWVKASDVYEYVGKKTTVTTKAGAYKMLFTLKGKELGHRALSANSSWATDKSTTINGEKMYRVATNEWVKASDVK